MFSAARGGFDYYSSAGLSLTFQNSYSVHNATGVATLTGVNANIGDIIFLIVTASNTSFAPAPVLATPTGFTNVVNIATSGSAPTAIRTAAYYQISTSSGSRTITSMAGTNGGVSNHMALVYTPSTTASNVAFTLLTSQVISGAPSNQTPTFPTMTNATVFFGYSSSSSFTSSPSLMLSSTVTPTRQVILGSGSTYYAVTDAFEGTGFSGTTTLSHSTGGSVNSLFSGYMVVS